jgi:DNA helicase-2/ATP-dependent DNA helicase PcrA
MISASGRLLYGGIQHNPPSRFLSENSGDAQAETSDYGSTQSFSPFGFDTPKPEPVSNEPRYVPDLNEGDGVRHQQFGVGTVLELDGDNAVIYFKGKGAKKLNISFAPLEKL